jgi:hypothetical protein
VEFNADSESFKRVRGAVKKFVVRYRMSFLCFGS